MCRQNCVAHVGYNYYITYLRSWSITHLANNATSGSKYKYKLTADCQNCTATTNITQIRVAMNIELPDIFYGWKTIYVSNAHNLSVPAHTACPSLKPRKHFIGQYPTKEAFHWVAFVYLMVGPGPSFFVSFASYRLRHNHLIHKRETQGQEICNLVHNMFHHNRLCKNSVSKGDIKITV